MTVMKLNDILASLDASNEKTAEDTTVDSASAGSKRDLVDTLRRGQGVKTASAAVAPESYHSPVGDLQKIASDIAAAEEDAIVKEAHLYGQSVCDGFMSRLSQYEKAADELGPESFGKTASAHQPMFSDPDGNTYTPAEIQAALHGGHHEKTSSYDSDDYEAHAMAQGIVKEAADNGYRLSHEDALEKVAQEAYGVGYNDTMEKAAEVIAEQGYHDTMEKAAEVAYGNGFEDTLEKAAEALHEAGQHEAVQLLEKAAFESGYEDALEKIAGSAFEQGVADMNGLLESRA